MIQWEYKRHVIDFDSPEDLQTSWDGLTDLGAEGWEVVLSLQSTGCNDAPAENICNVLLLKRPISN